MRVHWKRLDHVTAWALRSLAYNLNNYSWRARSVIKMFEMRELTSRVHLGTTVANSVMIRATMFV